MYPHGYMWGVRDGLNEFCAEKAKFEGPPNVQLVLIDAVNKIGGHGCLLKTFPQCQFWFRIQLHPKSQGSSYGPAHVHGRRVPQRGLPHEHHLDIDVVNPVEFDYYLYGGAMLLHTSRPAHYNVLVDENNFTPSLDGLVAPWPTGRAEARVVHEKDLETDHIHWARFELSPFSRHLPGLLSFRTPANSTLFYTSTSPIFSDSITNTLLPQHTKLYVHACMRAKNHYDP
ncbi:hypothetical protein BC826DRAFT_1108027 [Russula brevipes]|nr:hypothetical protein BC826DRAFT_1108027 [Russula brevipes]